MGQMNQLVLREIGTQSSRVGMQIKFQERYNLVFEVDSANVCGEQGVSFFAKADYLANFAKKVSRKLELTRHIFAPHGARI